MECKHYQPVDTTVILTKDVSVNIQRDPLYFGRVFFQLWNPSAERISPNTEQVVADHKVTSNGNGIVSLLIPLSEQDTIYSVSSSTIIMIDSMVTLPCGPNVIIQFE